VLPLQNSSQGHDDFCIPLSIAPFQLEPGSAYFQNKPRCRFKLAERSLTECGMTLDPETRSITLQVQEEIYPLDVVHGAAYLFLDRCYLWLSRPPQTSKLIEVTLRTREPLPATGGSEILESLAGEFGNELLNQALRKQIGEANGKLREFIMARAFFAGDVPSTVDRLLAELDAEEMATDSLEVAVPWLQDPK
jgi:His-Xaa-Ser system protein HxsD